MNLSAITHHPGVDPMTPRSRPIGISTEDFPNSSRGNEVSSRNRQIKVRKNEMKLRKKDFEVPKNLSTPRWKMKSLYGRTWRFLRRDLDGACSCRVL
ncbi:Uncharacterised protein [Chlamydia trachomatis]|nr:Uncharacterised protein [Chlamydia trachomatis]